MHRHLTIPTLALLTLTHVACGDDPVDESHETALRSAQVTTDFASFEASAGDLTTIDFDTVPAANGISGDTFASVGLVTRRIISRSSSELG